MTATSRTVPLPQAGGGLSRYTLGATPPIEPAREPIRSRVAYAAVHVAGNPLADPAQGGAGQVDWDATLAYRRYLWDLGLGVAEAMDTAQRGMGLDWPAAAELIRRSAAEARAAGGLLACGASTDQLPEGSTHTLADVTAAYQEQCALVEEVGARPVVMASRALARAARGPDDYVTVYGKVLSQLRTPAILHWLGEVFDPALAGYWGSRDLDEAAEVLLAIVGDHAARVDGVKVSLLDKEREVELRRRLPAGVRLYTGDDFNYPELILGDGERASDALLGIFDAIAPAAVTALQALDRGDVARYQATLEPTLPLARHIFQAPTFNYKTGVVFLAWLNGHQSHFRMLGGMESARSVVHLAELVVLADRAGLLHDPDLAARRLRLVLALAGIE